MLGKRKNGHQYIKMRDCDIDNIKKHRTIYMKANNKIYHVFDHFWCNDKGGEYLYYDSRYNIFVRTRYKQGQNLTENDLKCWYKYEYLKTENVKNR